MRKVLQRSVLFNSRLSGILLVAMLLCLWEASVRTGVVRSSNWPAFSAVIASLVRGIFDGDLMPVILSSFWRMLLGYISGCAVGVLVGLAIAMLRPIRLTLEPTVELLRPIPITAIIPPLIFVFGLDDPLKVFCVAFATFFPVALNTMDGIAAVDPIYVRVGRMFGVPKTAMILRVVLPAALPFILAGLRTSLGIAVIVTVIAEMIAGQQGIGFYLLSMQFALRAADMYAAIILLSCMAYLLNRAFVAWEDRVIRWARARETAQGQL